MAHYQVQDPQGETHVIEGPDDASPDDVVTQAKSLIPSSSPSVGGFVGNLEGDVKDTASGLGSLAKSFVNHPIDTAVNTVKSMPSALLNEGKRLGLGNLVSSDFPYVHPVDTAIGIDKAFYNKPLTTALDFSALFGGGEDLAESMGDTTGEVAKSLAKEPDALAPSLPETPPEALPKPLIPQEPVSAPVSAPAPAPTPDLSSVGKLFEDNISDEPKSSLKDLLKETKNKIPGAIADPAQELKNYLQNQYGKVANKPGFAQSAADYLRRYSQNMSTKNLGASPFQAKSVGPDAARALGKYALDEGITSPAVGVIGMEKKVAQINDIAGKQIGKLRDIADTRGSLPPMQEIVSALKSKFDPIYTKGIESSQKGSYMKALQEVERAEATHQGLAKLATKLNQSATAANKLNQASGAISDVANEISKFNNASISRYLKPEEIKAYESALKDFGATKKIQQFMIRKASREVAGRLGPGGGVRQLVQNFLDGFGYRAQAKIASKMADFIEQNPSKVSDLPSLFKEFAEQIKDVGDEATHAFD